jgi:hypothetical protein
MPRAMLRRTTIATGGQRGRCPAMLAATFATVAALASGCLAGALHVVTGPDHLAAVAPLASQRRGGAWRDGLRWGIGHSAGVLAVGAAALALRGLIDVAALSGWSERLVGVMLIGIGLWIGQRACSRRLHLHVHHHDGAQHAHAHLHGANEAHDPAVPSFGRLAHGTPVDLRAATAGSPVATAVAASTAPAAHRHDHAAFAVGTLHGLAGSSHVVGILPALALPTIALGGVYLAAFCVGTVLAMVVFAAAVGGLARRCAGHGLALYRGMLGLNAAAALAVGCWWLFGTIP